jgi:hypothetical protein
MELRYSGFTQLNNVRKFIFRGIAAGEKAKIFLVTVDLTLFAKHDVRLQEGPLLCQWKLSSDLRALSLAQSRLQRQLCENDISAFAADRDLQREKKLHGREKRKHRRSHKSSGSKIGRVRP